MSGSEGLSPGAEVQERLWNRFRGEGEGETYGASGLGQEESVVGDVESCANQRGGRVTLSASHSPLPLRPSLRQEQKSSK